MFYHTKQPILDHLFAQANLRALATATNTQTRTTRATHTMSKVRLEGVGCNSNLFSNIYFFRVHSFLRSEKR